MLHRKKYALCRMVLNITKTDTSQPENDLNIISRLPKHVGDNNQDFTIL